MNIANINEAERRRYLARMSQRKRREGKTRIDFYVPSDASKVIDSLRQPIAGYDASSILNRIVIEWARDRNFLTS